MLLNQNRVTVKAMFWGVCSADEQIKFEGGAGGGKRPDNVLAT